MKIENLWKEYRLGVFGHGMLFRDVQSWWARARGKEDPNTRVDAVAGSNGKKDRIWALRDVSLEVRQGEVLGIIGRNGAGKSTLLKIVTKVTAPTKGTVKIRGRVASLLEVGTGFHPELTGRENVYLNGAILGMTVNEIKRKFDEIIDFAGIEKFVDTPVKRYSSGMYVRLAFAVAAHLEPEILLVDEVLAVGDAAFQKKCLGKMEEVSKAGRTVLFVSHNMAAVRALCSRAVWIDAGSTVLNAEVSEVLQAYISHGKVEATPTVSYESEPMKKIQIMRITLLNHNMVPDYRLDMLKPFTVAVDYEVREPVAGVVVSASIENLFQEALLSTCDADLDRSRLGDRRRGRNHTRVSFPGGLFNSGKFRLVVGITIPGKVVYDRREAFVFELYDSGSFVVSGGGEERRNSILLIGLPWEDAGVEQAV